MRHWFQNLNESGKRLFEFRGSIQSDSRMRRYLEYSAWSGPALRFTVTHGQAGDDDHSTSVSIGLVFFTLHLKFPLPERMYGQKKCIATWDGNKEFYLTQGREYGFYWHEWTLWWTWHAKVYESSSRDPKWMRFNFSIPDFLFGRTEYIASEVAKARDIRFKLGGKEFVMNEITWERRRWFRRHVPISIYCRKMYGVDMRIDKPPMRAGKGENSWDCGDDGTYGLSMPWKHQKPSWTNLSEIERVAVTEYVDHILKDAKRYGSGDGERGISSKDPFEYLGRTSMPDVAAQVQPSDNEGCDQ